LRIKGVKMLTTKLAMQLALEKGIVITQDVIKNACRKGFIKNAIKPGHDYIFDELNFLEWLEKYRPKPRKK
jgi:hypothetical protein